LLAACGLSIAACTPTNPPAAKDTIDGRAEPIASPELEPPLEPTPQGDPATPWSCENPTAVLRGGVDTGYVQCADGAINRAQVLACPDPIDARACAGTEGHRTCDTDADCTDKPNGYCMGGSGQIGTYCGCIYPCLSDAECAPNEACICPGVGPRHLNAATCAPAECKVNDDCGSGECGASFYFNGCQVDVALACRDGGDSCHSQTDCEGFIDCAVARDGQAFECAPQTCVIGRPLTVDGGVRVASTAERRWGAARLDGLASDRARAAYWLGVARMEHASVASFARFTRELLGFGAPPQLLADALIAAADEVRHAEQTFALASAYAGEPLGPGPLQVDDLRPTTDLELFVTRLIVEGCVGETLGVAEALALLEHDVDPQLRPLLERIAADETRHAALAWRTLTWIADRVDASVIDRAFERAIDQVTRVDEESTDPAHGRLGTDAKRRVRGQALASVIEPCRRRILAS